MIKSGEFKLWLKSNTAYSDAVIGDVLSRIKRADGMLCWDDADTYLFYLEREERFGALSGSVRSQIRKAVKLYAEYRKETLNDQTAV